MKTGLITYAERHHKSQSVLRHLLPRGGDFTMFVLPWVDKPQKLRVIQHRPTVSSLPHQVDMARRFDIPVIPCKSDLDIGGCDLYLILGAGILSPGCVRGKRILNSHPGIIPAVRGLDAFKWAIHDGLPLGCTLHYIDEQVDAGEIVAVKPTSIDSCDTIATLASKHYWNEIEMLYAYRWFLSHPVNEYAGIDTHEPHKRMSRDTEEATLRRFPLYVDLATAKESD